MQIGYVEKKEMAVQESDGEIIKKSYYEMNIRMLFGTIERFTLSRNKSDKQNAPYFNIYAHNPKGWTARKLKAGGLWLKSLPDGTKFLSGAIETPMVDRGKLQISLWNAKPMYDGEDVAWEYDVVWKPYNPSEEEQTQPNKMPPAPKVKVMPAGSDIDISDEEIPF